MNREAMIAALRESADWLAAHPEVAGNDFWGLSVHIPGVNTPASLRTVAKAMGTYKVSYGSNTVHIFRELPSGAVIGAGLDRDPKPLVPERWADAILNAPEVMDKVVDGVMAEIAGGGK